MRLAQARSLACSAHSLAARIPLTFGDSSVVPTAQIPKVNLDAGAFFRIHTHVLFGSNQTHFELAITWNVYDSQGPPRYVRRFAQSYVRYYQ